MRIIGCILGVMFWGATSVFAQTEDVEAWQVYGWPDGVGAWGDHAVRGDSLSPVGTLLLDHLRKHGYYSATLDSTQIRGRVQHVYITPGLRVRIDQLIVRGMQEVSKEAVLQQMDLRPSEVWRPDVLEADINRLLRYYNRLGFPLAEITVASVRPNTSDEGGLAVELHVKEGPQVRLTALEIVNAERVQPEYVARVAGLSIGETLVSFDPSAIRQRLLETRFFETVEMPELVQRESTEVAVRIAVKEAAPGAFDLVLGLLPNSEGGVNFVGNGHLNLQNLFGGGRTMALKLNRLPGQVSSVDAHVYDPYVGGTPFSGEVQFAGYQQSSTFSQQRYRVEVGFRLPSGIEALANLSREQTRPGQDGLALVGTPPRQQIPRSSALFYGIGFRYQRLDDALNPRKGWHVESRFERGRKERSNFLRTAAGDTTTERSAFGQERLTFTGRAFIPTWSRQVWVWGGDASALNSSVYDESDLFRFGGATSLRGYDEDRFTGRFVGRLLTEYRVQLERQSYAYLFFDLGFVERPTLGNVAADRTVYPGYGLGMQFETGVGLINVSYALSSESGPTEGRVHVGLSFGL